MTTIDLNGLDKAEVLAALYNAASPAGMGFIQAARSPETMTVAEARTLLMKQQKFDYLKGRSFKVNLSSDQLDPWLYDRDNGGEGTAERIIERLRQTGAVHSSEYAAHRQDVTMEREYQQPEYAELAEVLALIIDEYEMMLSEVHNAGIPEAPTNFTGRQYLDWASDQALRFFNEDPKKAILVFLMLVDKHPDTTWIVTHGATPMLMQVGIMGGRHEMERMMKGFAA